MASGVSSKDAAVNNEIFRKDNPMILACDRHLATILPVRLAYVSGGYKAGQVLGRNSVSGNYEKYDNGASSGLDTAVCVLMHAATPASSDTELAKAVFGGRVYEDKLTGLDSNGKTDLKSRSIVDASGSQILIF